MIKILFVCYGDVLSIICRTKLPLHQEYLSVLLDKMVMI